MPNDERTFIPLKELVSFDAFQQIFEKMMENADRRMEEDEYPECLDSYSPFYEGME